MNYYFYLTLFTMGEPWEMIVLFVFFGGEGWYCVVWGNFFICFFFWKTPNRAQIIVFGRFGGPEKGL